MHTSTSTSSRGPRRTHGIMARLTRLAAGVLVVTLIIGAFAARCAEDAHEHLQNVCIHDEIQQRVADSVAQQGLAPHLVSRVGLPYVSSAAHVDNALAGSSAPDVTRSTDWGEMRITVSSDDLTDPDYHCATVGQVINNRDGDNVTCTADDIMTDEKRDILMNYLIPQALQMHKDRLQVHQVQDTWQVTGMAGETCGDFKVPEAHLTTGVSNTDFVIYVASVPSEAGVLAWATTCQVFTNDQPAVGVINIPAAFIAERYDQYMIHTVTHEIAHALGFSGTFFTYTGMGQTRTGVRGKTYNVPVINSTTVVAKTRDHYACDAAEYMELEDAGGSGTMGSHWKIRNAQDELMAGVAGVGYYTELTMSAFEDLGYYKADYSKAETMKWGHDAGCSFLDGKCVIDNVTQFPSMYCDTNERVFRCQPARLSLGTCVVSNYASALAEYFQYFTVPTLGGQSSYYDYCPYIGRWGVGSCTQAASAAPATVSGFNTFSMSSRCIDGTFTPKSTGGAMVTAYLGMCANLACNTADKTYSIQVNGHDAYIPCTPGQTIDLTSVSDAFEAGGTITCPPYVEVCQSNVQAAMDYESMINSASASSTPTTPPTSAAPASSSASSTPTAPPTSAAPASSSSQPNPVQGSSSSTAPGSASSSSSSTTRGGGDGTADHITPRTAAMALLALALGVACV